MLVQIEAWVYELSWFFACLLQCNNFCVDQHHAIDFSMTVFWICTYWTNKIGSARPFVLLSVLPSVHVSSWNWTISFFFLFVNFGMVLETLAKFCVTEPDACWCKFAKIRRLSNFFSWVWLEMGVASLFTRF